MKITCAAILGLALLQSGAYAADFEVRVVDGKVSVSAQAVPLGQLLSALDRAVGLSSQIKPELANRNISVRFADLTMREAVHKIFEGQPLNYIYVEGKGIRVTETALAGAGPSTSSPGSAPFQDPSLTVTGQPFTTPGGQPLVVQPAGAPSQPATTNTPFGGVSTIVTSPAAATGNSAFVPGQLPPPIGTNNTAPANPPIVPLGAVPLPPGFMTTPLPQQQPAGPGTLGGSVTPGVITR